MNTALGARPSAPGLEGQTALGTAWLVEAAGCDAGLLCDVDALAALFDAIVADLALHPVAPPVWWDPLESTCRHASLSIL